MEITPDLFWKLVGLFFFLQTTQTVFIMGIYYYLKRNSDPLNPRWRR